MWERRDDRSYPTAAATVIVPIHAERGQALDHVDVAVRSVHGDDSAELAERIDTMLWQAWHHTRSMAWHGLLDDANRFADRIGRPVGTLSSLAGQWSARAETHVDVAVDLERVGGTWGATADLNGLLLPDPPRGRRISDGVRNELVAVTQALACAFLGAKHLHGATWAPPFSLARVLRRTEYLPV